MIVEGVVVTVFFSVLFVSSKLVVGNAQFIH